MPPLAAAFSILTAIAGLYYLLGAHSAQRLGTYEGHVLNRKRIRLRRVGGTAMLVLAAAFLAGSLKQADRLPPRAFIAIWMVVMLMLLLIVVLALLDLRLTYRLYQQRQEHHNP